MSFDMDTSPSVSIIVPVYKAEAYLPGCLGSIQAQTFANWECILVDDGSPDSSGLICDEFSRKDNRFKTFHKSNGGVSSARNMGLEKASGKYVMFVDSDDEIADSTVELCLDMASRNNIDILQYSLTKEHNELGLLKNHSKPLPVPEYIQKQLFLVCIGGSFIRRSVIEENHIRFDESLKQAEDLIFVHTCFAHSKLCQRLFHLLYFYRYNETSASNNRKTADMFRTCEAEQKFKKLHPLFSGALDSSISHYIIQIIKNGDYDYDELYATLSRDIPYNKSQMQGAQLIFATLAGYNISLAIKFIKLRYWIRKLILNR